MNDTNETVLRIRGLEKTFDTGADRLTIIKDLDLTAPEGAQVAIVGESGSGKSTLLNIIAGLDTPTRGEILVGGRDITSLPEDGLARFRSKFLGLIFQFHYLLQDFSALENVYLPAFMAGEGRKSALERAKTCLEAVGMGHRMNHMPSELSGGERQRVSVARSLINDPRLILADEPTGNLDPANAAMIGELLFSLAGSYKKTLLLVTHDMELAGRAHIRYRLKEGKLQEEPLR
ncbi:MAG: ABC transporter ATP-binding protein [Spirochaetaceae bacterium]|jgi:lipoprotein-releasing system ATP-binding protein|nr:ABC transporter ATP-binding protein [Spirochaetaceae bacterium]